MSQDGQILERVRGRRVFVGSLVRTAHFSLQGLRTLNSSMPLALLLFTSILALARSVSIVPPIIDIGPLTSPDQHTPADFARVEDEIAAASKQWGFFHIVNHGISSEDRDALFEQMRVFFGSSKDVKYTIKRRPDNSRGFADDELTKQIVDSKEIVDIGQVHFEGLSEEAQKNQLLDGTNLWPTADHLINFKPVSDAYYAACLKLSEILFTTLMGKLTCDGTRPSLKELTRLDSHSSFLRLNMYPIVNFCDDTSELAAHVNCTMPGKLGISRHTDAGILTLLLQDAVPALEVYSATKQDFNDGEWVPVDPVPGAITVNTGDMLQVWSNGVFKAPEHRVRASVSSVRYSAPFFYNPAYDSHVAPILCSASQTPKYKPIRWGDYRADRFAGDYADVGKEIQIEAFSNDEL